MARKEELNAENPVVAVAHEEAEKVAGPVVITTSAGVRMRVRRVSPFLIATVQSRIKDPPVPEDWIEEKQRSEPNPANPVYLAALQQVRMERTIAGSDANIMFGLELVDGLPEDRIWLQKLSLLGIEVDESDPLAVEFAYKKYIVLGADEDVAVIRKAMRGVTAEGVKAAEAGFQRPEG